MAGATDRTGRRNGVVLDCSVALGWCFTDERSAPAAAVLDALATCPAIVPGLWPYEIANALLLGERRRRSTREDSLTWLRFLSQLPIAVDEEPVSRSWGSVLELARSHSLSA